MDDSSNPMTAQRKKPLLRGKISIRTILPNMVTLSAFVMGLTSIRLAILGKYELALACLAAAAILDALDGTVARLLKSTSRFGAELDSLSDVVAFGVAPAVMIYLWSLSSLDRIGWAAATIFSVATALRLARFNAHLDDEEEPHKKLGFFTGIPAPLGASLMVLPMVLDYSFTDGFIQGYPGFVALHGIIIALLMVSTIPTPSLKKLRIHRRSLPPLMLVLAGVLLGLIARPWHVAAVLSLGYLVLIPVTYGVYRKRLSQKRWLRPLDE